MLNFDFITVSELLNKEILNIDLDKNPKELYQPVRYFMDLGGKRMRPILSVLSCYLFDNEYVKAVKPSIAIEIFHNFTLIHDDIMDKAPLRRGKPTVHQKWNENIALLAGDVALIKAYQQLEFLPIEIRKDIVALFNTTAIEVCEGQQLDMNFEIINDVSLEEYLDMIQLKTAVLLGFSMYMGARLGGTTIENAKKMYDCGVAMGMAFQIKDDYLDAFADVSKFGKQVGGDIMADKKTFLMLKALQLDTSGSLQAIIGNKSFELTNKVSLVLDIYNNLKIKDLTDLEMKKYFNSAIFILKSMDIEIEKIKFVESYFTQLFYREN